LTRRQLLRLACDADISRVVLDTNGAVLDLGRSSRTVTAPQWRALVARDRDCIVKGCRRRPAECEAHHVQHWALGGPSDLGNYALVCHLHHHQLHEGGRTLQHQDGRWLTPDGYRDPGPPPPPF
ncbi:MAG: putative endonuclease, partial [Frankiales bacterium]|nr:putative endonuclease [Frankiales bacterium]